MRLSGQADKDFSKWISTQKDFMRPFIEPKLINAGFIFNFYSLPDAMQFGVFMDWFEEAGYSTEDLLKIEREVYALPEARVSVVKKLEAIYNEINKP